MFGLIIRRLGSGGRSVQITTSVSTGNAAVETVICANEHAQALELFLLPLNGGANRKSEEGLANTQYLLYLQEPFSARTVLYSDRNWRLFVILRPRVLSRSIN